VFYAAGDWTREELGARVGQAWEQHFGEVMARIPWDQWPNGELQVRRIRWLIECVKWAHALVVRCIHMDEP
jgi:hypothetical protein